MIAIDPGNEQSALVEWDGEKIRHAEIMPNRDLLAWLRGSDVSLQNKTIVLEMVACYGMPVGATVFETCVWIGRFLEAAEKNGGATDRLFRKDVKMHLCQSMRAKDSNIRQALIDRFGPPGTKKEPGLTYGLKKDLWAAFAVAVTWEDSRPSKREN